MTTNLAAPKVALLAVHFAAKSDTESLTLLASQHDKVLQTELLLRILLTCLPETLEVTTYVPLIQGIASGQIEVGNGSKEIDTSSLDDITEAEAAKKVRKLRLLPLTSPNVPKAALEDPISLFLIQRARRLDEQAGLLSQLPSLLIPFLDHAPCIRTWTISAVLPLLRRNIEYYPNAPLPQSLSEFEALNDKTAVLLLLEQTGAQEQDLGLIGRDLRGLIGPWLYNEARWRQDSRQGVDSTKVDGADINGTTCAGWEQLLEWLVSQSTSSWRIAVKAIEQWDGPSDADLGDLGSVWLEDDEQGQLERSYARAALAAAYLIPEASLEALAGVNSIISKITTLLDQDPCPTLQVASSLLSPFVDLSQESVLCAKNATHLRNDMLHEGNILTTPTKISTTLLHVLALSAFILTKAGTPCNIRTAGELAFLQDEREQRVEATKFIQALRSNAPRKDEKFWIRARNELLWLRDWGAEEASESGVPISTHGILGQLKRSFLEIECLKAFLAAEQYPLARATYENNPEQPIPSEVLEETIIAAAMHAYDNASNPNRSRGGLLKCSDIVHAFPKTVPENGAPYKRIEALLRATHGLSEYRLVLKQGEPFTPVVLRVHSDPISILDKVLEQNPKAYTSLQHFLELGSNMVDAGLVNKDKSDRTLLAPDQQADKRLLVERRITAMCIDSALAEDDFETAYSYVVNRLTSRSGPATIPSGSGAPAKGAIAKPAPTVVDDYSWKAALQAGKYRRTSKTTRPTHIGTASGNLDIRHLEQRIECLSTALRIAPPATLQEILNVFRRCEEELDAAVKAENETESAWDDVGDREAQAMPGAFSSTVPAGVRPHNAARNPKNQDEAPMSLFDLSRATMSRAQVNLNALSSLQRSGQARDDTAQGPQENAGAEGQPRVRRRDQLANAAVGTLASGVGWLIGAQPSDRAHDRE